MPDLETASPHGTAAHGLAAAAAPDAIPDAVALKAAAPESAASDDAPLHDAATPHLPPGTATRPPREDRSPRPAKEPGPVPREGVVKPILIHPDPRLRDLCEPAALIPPDDREQLAADLLVTMYAAKGRGLAAPQIGRAVRMFVMDADWKTGTPAPLVMLDPQFLSRSEGVERAEEQCLSIPDQPLLIERASSVRIRWFDLAGSAHEADLTGAAARIAQHEYDHLDGILIVDDRAARG